MGIKVIRERRRNPGGSGNDDDAQPMDIHVWLERFMKQKPQSFSSLDEETSTEFMKRFPRLVGFLGAKAGTQEEQAKNFKWGLNDFILDMIVNIEFTDVAQVANIARNIEIMRDGSGQEGNNKRNKDGHRMTDMATTTDVTDMATTSRGYGVITISKTGANNMVVLMGHQARGDTQIMPYLHHVTFVGNFIGERRVWTDMAIVKNMATTYRHDRHATATDVTTWQDKQEVIGVLGSARLGPTILVFYGVLQAKRGYSRDYAFISTCNAYYGNFIGERRVTRLLVLALHVERLGIGLKIVRKAANASVPSTLLNYALSISTPMGNNVLISHEYRSCPLHFDDKIRFANLLPLEISDFEIILDMEWLIEHRATIDCHTKHVIFGDLNNPEFIYHGFWPGKPIKIISAFKALTLISNGCEGFLASIILKVSPFGEVSYRLSLPPQLSHVHNVFHLSLLRCYKYHPLHVVSYPLDHIREDLSFLQEPEAILDRQERVMRNKAIPFVKIL
ncbi:putative reverse transcriptase domain-containing protein [Tanacetum coccineum]